MQESAVFRQWHSRQEWRWLRVRREQRIHRRNRRALEKGLKRELAREFFLNRK